MLGQIPNNITILFYHLCSLKTQDPKSESGGTGAADREGQGRTPLTFGGCLGARVGEVHVEEQVLLGLYEEAREVSLHGGKLFNLILH